MKTHNQALLCVKPMMTVPHSSLKCPAVDNVSTLTNVAQVIGSPNLSASTRYSLPTNHSSLRVPHIPTPVACLSLAWFTANRRVVCLPWVLFASARYCGSNPSVLVSRPLTAFKKALETRKHADKEHHNSAIVRTD